MKGRGLTDDYTHDGCARVETFTGWAIPPAIKKNSSFVPLCEALKQVNAPFPSFGILSLQASTAGIMSGNATDDSTYAYVKSQLAALGNRHEALSAEMIMFIESAEFQKKAIADAEAANLLTQRDALLSAMQSLASHP